MTTKYDINVPSAKLSADGYFSTAGWITVYRCDSVTDEYICADYEYIPVGVGLPAHAYTDKPKSPPAGYALRRTVDGAAWEHIRDYRGQTAYDTTTVESVQIDKMGELPDSMTLIAPLGDFQKWNGKEWVEDVTAKKKAAIAESTTKLASLLVDTNVMIAPLTDAVDMGMATDVEIAKLAQLKKYRIELTRIDVNNAPEINWPEFSETL